MNFGYDGSIVFNGYAAFFSVPYKTMTIDGNYSDWTSEYRAYLDLDGPDCSNSPGLDLKEVYLAQDEGFIYLRFVLNGALDPTYGYKFGTEERHIYVGTDGSNNYFFYASGSNLPSPDLPASFLHIDGNQFECKFYKSDVISYWNGVYELHAWLDQGRETDCRDYVDRPFLKFGF